MSSTTHARDARIIAARLAYSPPDGRPLLHDLDLSLGRERVGLIGPNGSGKTTLVRLLAGELSPSSGTVQRAGSVAVLPQDFHPAREAPLAQVLGIADRLAAIRRIEGGKGTPADLDLADGGWDIAERAAVVLARFGLDHLPLDRPIGAVSGGEATRAALAGLALAEPDVLLLDEPTNHLDAASRAALYRFVESWPGALLCVSHDRALLRRMDRIVELSSLGARSYGGNYDAYRMQRDAEDAAAERELASARAALRTAEREAREVRERQARRDAQGRRSRKTANMPKILLNTRKAQAEATSAGVRAITEREVEERRERVAAARRRVEERERPRFALPSAALPAGRTVLSLQDVTFGFPGEARPVLDDVSLSITGPERVAIAGPNGSGKTTLLRIVTGTLSPDSGTVRRLPDEEIAFLDQHGALDDPALTVLESFRARHSRMDATAVRHALARFLFSDEAALQPAGTLSGGQRLRASLACALGGTPAPSLLVLDEPTNHLDLDGIEALEEALRAWDGAMIVVSHDAEFLEQIGVEREFRL